MIKFIKLFKSSFIDLKDCVDFIRQIDIKNTKEVNAHAMDFLNIFALVAVGYTWLQFIKVSHDKIRDKDDSFYLSKIQLGEFFMTKVIFETKRFKNNIYSSGNLYNHFPNNYFETGN